jgi:ABC-type glycerol-3-phosphate transport system substrate-binding protein
LTNYLPLFNSSTDVTTATAKESYGNLFVGGYSGNLGSEDFTTLKYRVNNYALTVTSFNGLIDSLSVNPSALTYQWYKDNALLQGETAQGINLHLYGNGDYFCQIFQ